MCQIDVRWLLWRSSQHNLLAVGCYFYLLIMVFNYYSRRLNSSSSSAQIQNQECSHIHAHKCLLHCCSNEGKRRTRYENCWFNIRRHYAKYKNQKGKIFIYEIRLWCSCPFRFFIQNSTTRCRRLAPSPSPPMIITYNGYTRLLKDEWGPFDLSWCSTFEKSVSRANRRMRIENCSWFMSCVVWLCDPEGHSRSRIRMAS